MSAKWDTPQAAGAKRPSRQVRAATPQFIWSPVQVAKLRKLASAGMSHSQLAEAFGVSKCAVAGALRRYGLAKPPQAAKNPGGRPTAAPAEPKRLWQLPEPERAKLFPDINAGLESLLGLRTSEGVGR